MRIASFIFALAFAGCGNPSAVVPPSSSSPSVAEVKPASNVVFHDPVTVATTATTATTATPAKIETPPTKPVETTPAKGKTPEAKKPRTKADASKLNDEGLIRAYRNYQSQHANIAEALGVLKDFGSLGKPDMIAELHAATRERLDELDGMEADFARYWTPLGLKLLPHLRMGSLEMYQDR